MSRTVDSRVVEMQFDNSRFERNVSTSMSTLEKLKQSLNLRGASKGLEEVNTAASKIDFSKMEYAATKAGFQIQDIWLKTASVLEYQVAGRIINVAKKMTSALTIDPIKTGFSEYETQINSTQTILANTKSKGSTIDDVNRALEELNAYADKTIYNFTEMTRNIGTFTAAGIDLETSTNAIQGIANLAAVSGSTSQQASTAMYQLSQALSSGTVRLMDWNSVVNAGMGGELFQNALKETSKLLGTGAEEAIKAQGSFRESLKTGWLTADVLTETLKKFTSTGANEYVAEYIGESPEYVQAALDAAKAEYGEAKAVEQAAKALAEKSGKNEQEIKDALEFAKTAEDAATKVKTFTQLWDVMKESAQSGWSQTWKIIVGDFEEAKSLLTPLADVLTGFIGKMSDARNWVVQGVMDFATPWKSIIDKLENSGIATTVKKVTDAVDEVTDKLEYYQKVVKKVWRGDYKNSDTGRYELLEADGYNHKVVQRLVNKGRDYKLTIEDIEEAEKKYGVTVEKSTEKTEDMASAIEDLTDEQLRNAGLTEDEIRLYRDVAKYAKKAGKSIDEYAKLMSENDGRTLLVDSFKNIGKSIISIFTAIGQAWREIFDPVSIVGIWDAIYVFNKWTETLRNSLAVYDEETGAFVKLTETGEKIKRTFQGVFAAIDIVTTILKLGFRIALDLVRSVLKYFNLDILDVTAKIGDVIVKFNEWIDSVLDFTGIFDKIIPLISDGIKSVKDWITNNVAFAEGFDKVKESISKAIDAIKEWIGALSLQNIFANITTALNDAVGAIDGWFESLKGKTPEEVARIIADSIGGVISGISGVFSNLGTIIKDKLKTIYSTIVDWFKSLQGLSPKEIGEAILDTIYVIVESIGNAISNLVGFIMDKMGIAGENFSIGFAEGIWDGIKFVVKTIIELGKIALNKLMGVLDEHSPSRETYEIGINFVQGFIDGIKSLFSIAWNFIKNFGQKCVNMLGDIKFDWSIISSGAMVLASFFPKGTQLFYLISRLASLAAALGETFLAKFKEVLGIHSPSTKFFEAAVNCLQGFWNGLKAFAGKVWDYIKLIAEKCIEIFQKVNIGQVIAAGLSGGIIYAITKLAEAVASLGKFAAPLVGLADLFEETGDALKTFAKGVKSYLNGKAVLNYAFAIGILAASLIALSFIKPTKLIAPVIAIGAMAGVLTALAFAISAIGPKDAVEAGKLALTLLALSGAIALLAFAFKQMSGLYTDEIIRGTVTLAILTTVLIGLMAAMSELSKVLGDKEMKNIGVPILKIAIAMLLLVGVIKLISRLEDTEIIKGLAVIGILSIFFATFIMISQFAGDASKLAGSMLIKMTFALLIMLGVIKLASKLNPLDVLYGMAVINLISLLFIAFIAVSYFAGEHATKAGSMLLLMSLAFAVMILTVRAITNLTDAEVKRGLDVISAVGLLFAVFIAVSKLAGAFAGKAGSMLISIAAAMLLLTGVIYIFGTMPLDVLEQGLAAVTLLTLCFAGLIAVTKYSKNSKLLNGALTKFIIAIGLMTACVVGLSFLDPKKLAGATAAIVALMGAFAVMITATKFTKSTKGLQGTLWSLMAITVLLSGLVVGLTWAIPADRVKSALASVAALSMLMIAYGAMLKIIAKGGSVSKTVAAQIWPMMGITTLLSGIVIGLAWAIPADRVKSALASVAALSILMVAFSASMVVLSKASAINVNAKQLYSMVGIVAILGAIIALMSFTDATGAIPNVIALSILLGAMTGAMFILSKIGPMATGVMGAVGAMALMAIPLFAFVAVLSSMQGVQGAITNAIALSLLTAAMSVALYPLCAVGNMIAGSGGTALLGLVALAAMAIPLYMFVQVMASMQGIQNALGNVLALTVLTTAMTLLLIPLCLVGVIIGATYGLAALGIVALLAMCVPLQEIVLILAAMENVQNAITSAVALSMLLSTIGSVLTVMAIVGPLALIGVAALTALVTLMLGIGSLIVAVGYIMDSGVDLEKFVNTGIPLLEKLANGIGSILGSLVSGFATAAVAALPAIAETLSDFMGKLQPFIDGAKELNETVLTGVKTLAESILILTAANILDGLFAFFTGGSSIRAFAEELPFLGTGIAKFIENVGSIDESNINTARVAAGIVKELASAAKEIPNAGGLLGELIGDNDISSWAIKLGGLGAGVSNFIANIGSIDDSNINTAKTAASIVKELASAAKEIPNTGGLLGDLVGNNDLASWAIKLGSLGTGISNFIQHIGSVDSSSVETAKVAASIVKELAMAAQQIPNAGGLLATFVGDNDLSTFATDLPKVGMGVAGFMRQVAEFTDAAVITSVNVAVSAVKALAALAGTDIGDFAKNSEKFSESVPSIGEAVSGFGSAMAGVEATAISSAATSVNRIVSMLKNMNGFESKSAESFKTAVKKIGETGFEEFAKALSGATAKTEIKRAAADMVTAASEGMEAKVGIVKTAVRSIINHTIEEIETDGSRKKFYNLGNYLVEGFAEGIRENKNKAINAAADMMKAAIKAAEEEGQINSPSKVFYGIGSFSGQGFVNALRDYGDKAYDAGSNMMNSASSGLNAAVSKIRDAINGDLDMQPTIAPVLDLSNVKSGAGAISGMFGTQLSVGAIGNVNAVSSLMNRNIQNGGNDDIISAIDKLNKNLSNVGGNSYNINGITYDDGSNIASAINTLVRATTVEGRI